jgi:hypothetical protein
MGERAASDAVLHALVRKLEDWHARGGAARALAAAADAGARIPSPLAGVSAANQKLDESHQADLELARGRALDCYVAGDYAGAEALLLPLLDIGFEVPGTHCHLARVCLMLDREADARRHVEEAWAHRAEAPAYVLPRILWLQTAFAMLDAADAPEGSAAESDGRREPLAPAEQGIGASLRSLLGRVRAALAAHARPYEWTIQPVLDRLAPRLAPGAVELLGALSAVIDGRATTESLDRFPAWREAGAAKTD